MRNITSKIKIALARASTWDALKRSSSLEAILNHIPSGVEDWDEGAGENWARILVEGKPVVYAAVNVPLLFIHSARADLVSLFPNEIVLLFDDEDREVYLLNEDFFLEWYGRKPDIKAFNPQSFSVSDLWWLTVTWTWRTSGGWET